MNTNVSQRATISIPRSLKAVGLVSGSIGVWEWWCAISLLSRVFAHSLILGNENLPTNSIVYKTGRFTNKLIALCYILSCIMVACQGNNTAVREFDALATDVVLHGRMAGNPKSGCVLVAINGGPGLTSNYMLDLEQLADPDCAVVTYDQRGMGKSSAPTSPDSAESYTLVKYAQDVEAIRQEVKAERIHLFGHSFGGIVAMQYAILYPEQVESLIFFGSGPPTWADIEASQKNFSARILALIQSGTIPPPDQWTEGGIDPLLPAYFADPTFTFPADSQGGAPEFNQQVNELTYTHLMQVDLRTGLAAIHKRVLLLMGSEDPFGLQMAEAIQKAMPGSDVEFKVISNCGHFWHECPDGFYPPVRQFLGIAPGAMP